MNLEFIFFWKMLKLVSPNMVQLLYKLFVYQRGSQDLNRAGRRVLKTIIINNLKQHILNLGLKNNYTK